MDSFKSWEISFDKQIDAFTEITNNIQRDAAYDLKEVVEKRTPIGKPELWNWPASRFYVPGTLQASWELIIEGKIFQLINETPYAQRVEQGWSTQAPAGMLRVSLLEWPQIVQKAARKYNL